MERNRFCHKKLALCDLQVLRGRGLDHEQREMSDKREVTSAGMHYAILHLTVDSASGKTEETRSLSQKTCTKCKFFVTKIKQYHAAAGEPAFGAGTRLEQATPGNLGYLQELRGH